MAQKLEYTVLDLIESATRNSRVQPLNLGGIAGAGGGVGAPPGGYIGWLPQTRVAYDEDEIASSGTPASGMSLLDNLNHIRYRLDIIESGGSIVVFDDNDVIEYPDTTVVHFSGAGVTVVDLGGGAVQVLITATGSGGGGTPLTVQESDGSPIVTNVDTIVFSGASVTDLGGGNVLVTISGGSVDGDSTYLRLDATNAPVTRAFVIQASNFDLHPALTSVLKIVNNDPDYSATVLNLRNLYNGRALVADVRNDNEVFSLEQLATSNGDINSDFLGMYRYADGSTSTTYTRSYLALYDYTSAGVAFSGGTLRHLLNDTIVLTEINPYTAPDGIVALFNSQQAITESGRLLSLQNQDIELAWVTGSGHFYDNGRQLSRVSHFENGIVNRYLEQNTTIPSGNCITLVDYIDTNGFTLTLDGDAVVAIVDGDTDSVGTGWTAATGTWTYSSADSPTFVISTSADMTGSIGVGYRIKLTQTTVKYFIVTAITASTITVYGGTDYTLANAAITLPYYSNVKAPLGFPISPEKWTVTATDTTDRSQVSPTQNTWYNLGSFSISIPIGLWNTQYNVALWSTAASQVNVGCYSSLSTANNSESDKDFRGMSLNNMPTGNIGTGQAVQVNKLLDLASKTTYYLITSTPYASMDTIYNYNSTIKSAKIRCVCAYL